jgi:hypothetical protein
MLRAFRLEAGEERGAFFDLPKVIRPEAGEEPAGFFDLLRGSSVIEPAGFFDLHRIYLTLKKKENLQCSSACPAVSRLK